MADFDAYRRRDETRSSTHARTTRTRTMLAEALRTALRAGREPSVEALCDDAGIARSTFYTHFASLDELALELLSDLFEQITDADAARRIEARLPAAELTKLGVAAIVRAITEQRELLVWAFRASPAVSESLRGYLAEGIQTVVRVARPQASEVFVEASSMYMSAGFLHVTVPWYEANGDIEELTEMIDELVPAWLSR